MIRGPLFFSNSAANSAILITSNIFQAMIMNGVAVIRPPGHHCEADKPMGFCLLGNVPIACRYAVDRYDVER